MVVVSVVVVAVSLQPRPGDAPSPVPSSDEGEWSVTALLSLPRDEVLAGHGGRSEVGPGFGLRMPSVDAMEVEEAGWGSVLRCTRRFGPDRELGAWPGHRPRWSTRWLGHVSAVDRGPRQAR